MPRRSFSIIAAFACSLLFWHSTALAQLPDLKIDGPAGVGPNEFRIDLDPSTGPYEVARRYPAGNFTIAIVIHNLSATIFAAHVDLHFDPTVVSLLSVAPGPAFGGAWTVPIAPGQVEVAADKDPCVGVTPGVRIMAYVTFAPLAADRQTGFDLTAAELFFISGPCVTGPGTPAPNVNLGKGVAVIGDASISCLNVNVTNDMPSINIAARNPDCNPALGIGDISMRSAIQVANAVTGGNRVTYRIPAMNPAIMVGAGGHALSDASGGTFLDGATQPMGTVHVDGPAAGATLSLASNGNTVKKLIFGSNPGGSGVTITGSSNTIVASRFGINSADGAFPNLNGIVVAGGANNVIGTALAGEGNVISSNAGDGLVLSGGSGTVVRNGRIGTNGAGLLARPNGVSGVYITNSTNNTIGGDVAGAMNVIAGNAADGVEITGVGGHAVLGNFIGVAANGIAALPNGAAGVFINNSPNNAVGNVGALARNVISGNNADGVEIAGALATNNSLRNNFIGTNAAGTAPVPNRRSGVFVNGAPNNTIGGGAVGDGNVISGNGLFPNVGHGVLISLAASGGNSLRNNIIGLNAAGTAAIPNLDDGVRIDLGAHDNIIGAAGQGNTISGNTLDGLHITGAGTDGNLARGNRIGTNLAESAAIANGDDGVDIALGAQANEIGGSFGGQGNLICGHDSAGRAGVRISGAATDDNRVELNRIGANAGGTNLPNFDGVIIELSAKANVLVQNSIFCSPNDGVRVQGTGTDQNEILDNVIGSVGLANFHAVHVRDGAKINQFTKNIIANNASHGMVISDDETDGNLLTSNAMLGNMACGLVIENGAASNFVGGTFAGASNLFDGNFEWAIKIDDAEDTTIKKNTIRHNSLGGVAVLAGPRNHITENSIHSNHGSGGLNGLGIDLSALGVSPNDPGDGDAGGNMTQNFPVLTSAVGGTIAGTLHSAPNTAYTIEFFANAACDASGHGEGETFLGSGAVTTDSSGDAVFSVAAAAPPPGQTQITATAIDPLGNTSEFSACLTWSPGAACAADITGDGEVDIDDLLAVISAWGMCPAPPATCAADIAPAGGDGQVDIDDLLAVISAWGPCP